MSILLIIMYLAYGISLAVLMNKIEKINWLEGVVVVIFWPVMMPIAGLAILFINHLLSQEP